MEEAKGQLLLGICLSAKKANKNPQPTCICFKRHAANLPLRRTGELHEKACKHELHKIPSCLTSAMEVLQQQLPVLY